MRHTRTLYRNQIPREGFASEWLLAALVLVTACTSAVQQSTLCHSRPDQKWLTHDLSVSDFGTSSGKTAARCLLRRIRSGAHELFLAPRMFLFTSCHPAPVRIYHPPIPRGLCLQLLYERRRCIRDEVHRKLEKGRAPNLEPAPLGD